MDSSRRTMRALHLPGLSSINPPQPPYSFPSHPAPASALTYTATNVPIPSAAPASARSAAQNYYLVKVSYTALTRSELTWSETLAPSRFTADAGPVPGHDLVGRVTALLPSTESQERERKFEDGEWVVALLGFERDGAAAEWAVAQEDELARVPAGLEVKEEELRKLAAVPLSGLSAWQALFGFGGLDVGRVERGKEGNEAEALRSVRVLVTGASGSVGCLAVQLAKAAGCFVVGTSSARNAEFVQRELGAEEVLDYTKFNSLHEGFEAKGIAPVDIVVDTVGGETLLQVCSSEKVLRKGGRVVSIAMPLKACGKGWEEAQMKLEEMGSSFDFFVVEPDGKQLASLMEMAAENRITGIVEGVYDLEKGREAMELVEKGRVRGKVVLTI